MAYKHSSSKLSIVQPASGRISYNVLQLVKERRREALGNPGNKD